MLTWLVPHETASVSAKVVCTPYNHAPRHFMQSHIRKVYACLAVTCHLHFWQDDRDLLHATAVTRGWNGYRNRSQHRKLTLEKKILPPLPQRFEPATFQSRVRPLSYPRYAAFLARRLKPSSVKQYLNIIRRLHLECNLDNPCADSWYLKTTIKGIEKVKGTEVIRKLPMTPELLLQIKEKLTFSKTTDCVLCAACMVMFHGLLWKSEMTEHP